MDADGPGDGGPASLTQSVEAALLSRRVVMAHGELDHARSSEVAAALMTLDALGDEHIELRLSAADGAFEAALVLVDVIEVLGVPVHTFGMGVIAGGAVGVLASGRPRVLSRHARLHLREPDVAASGRAADIERALAEQAARRDSFYRHLARCTGRSLGEIESEWSAGSFFGAEDAVTLGYSDRVMS
ncbi:MAG TPA: ATP-dependent Clp protease proteolytic subunit [Acidimicrobiales bacterium]|nr:ATP-dependent Clp protease proteolytic subunit [Acidimicrobiales bacterium]